MWLSSSDGGVSNYAPEIGFIWHVHYFAPGKEWAQSWPWGRWELLDGLVMSLRVCLSSLSRQVHVRREVLTQWGLKVFNLATWTKQCQQRWLPVAAVFDKYPPLGSKVQPVQIWHASASRDSRLFPPWWAWCSDWSSWMSWQPKMRWFDWRSCRSDRIHTRELFRALDNGQ